LCQQPTCMAEHAAWNIPRLYAVFTEHKPDSKTRQAQTKPQPSTYLIDYKALAFTHKKGMGVCRERLLFTMQSVTLYSAKGNLLQHKRLPLESQPDTTANSRALSPPHRSSYIPPDCLLLPECRYMSSALRRCISDCGRNLLQHGQRNLRQCRTPHH